MSDRSVPAALGASGLRVGHGRTEILRGLDVDIPCGAITAIVGANASGKSTLLRALARLLDAREGRVLLDGADIARVPPRDLARRLGFLPQSPQAPEGLTVGDLVSRGRFPHRRAVRGLSARDRDAVHRALERTGTLGLRDRPLERLSGGQRQRVWIALALAQETGVVLLDEPTTFLDLAHQIEVLELLMRLNADEGRTIVMVLHDLNQALHYADHLIAVKEGRVHAAGPPSVVVSEDLVESVFGVRARIVPDPDSGEPLCLPLPSRRPTATGSA